MSQEVEKQTGRGMRKAAALAAHRTKKEQLKSLSDEEGEEESEDASFNSKG